jgi:phage terminase small subunit
MQPLSEQQARFVEQYLVDPVAARAAERAGYSAKSARAQGSRLLKLPQVRTAIREGEERRAAKVEVKADEVIRDLKVMALARDDIRDSGKLKALELLGRHLKLFTDKVEQTGPSFADLVLEAQRLREKRDREKGLNPYTHRPLQPGEQGYTENEAAAKAAQAAAARSASEPPPAWEAPKPSPARAAEPSRSEI